MHPHSFLDAYSLAPPPTVAAIHADTTAIGFNMASTDATGRMLRTLAAGKPGGRMLELGTGTGLATAWLLDGMDAAATLDTVDINPACVAVARKNPANDPRVRFHIESGSTFLKRQQLSDTTSSSPTHFPENSMISITPSPSWPSAVST